MDKFYLIRRNDGYVFIQRYMPKDYGDVTFEVIGEYSTQQDAVKAYEKFLGL